MEGLYINKSGCNSYDLHPLSRLSYRSN